jgi:DNA invertase Pin-like site-specific DNA recombinase
MMKIGYARVSTKDKQELDLQIDALTKEGCEKIYKEKASGKNNAKRPELEALLEYAREGDEIVIWKLDRLGRSTKSLISLSEDLKKRGVGLVSVKDKIDTSTASGKAMFGMLAVLAEMEADLVSERTKAGLEAARARGRKGGRASLKKDKVEMALRMYDSREYSIPEILEATGISRASLYKYINARKEEKGLNSAN